jgi:hypothetical protein
MRGGGDHVLSPRGRAWKLGRCAQRGTARRPVARGLADPVRERSLRRGRAGVCHRRAPEARGPPARGKPRLRGLLWPAPRAALAGSGGCSGRLRWLRTPGSDRCGPRLRWLLRPAPVAAQAGSGGLRVHSLVALTPGSDDWEALPGNSMAWSMVRAGDHLSTRSTYEGTPNTIPASAFARSRNRAAVCRTSASASAAPSSSSMSRCWRASSACPG